MYDAQLPLQVWMGYTQSLRPEQLGLALNVDMAVTAFLEPGPVIDSLTRAAGLRDPHDFARATREQVRKADKAIAGIKVRMEGLHAMGVARNLRGLPPVTRARWPSSITVCPERSAACRMSRVSGRLLRSLCR